MEARHCVGEEPFGGVLLPVDVLGALPEPLLLGEVVGEVVGAVAGVDLLDRHAVLNP
ncbi:hypothetical protein ACGFJC_09750 [Nonomuraea fuscirosea]|uniref:hypothetical protein n=1 Tax=Nonomuraea fuscirosea TaxID=1291556 RepID=UPI0034169D56